MIEEEYVSFETAKLAKEKGFDEFCSSYYNELGIHNITVADKNSNIGSQCSAPTQARLAKWLREKYKLNVSVMEYIDEDGYDLWMYCLRKSGKTDSLKSQADFETYEEAMEAGLQEALKLIN